MAAPATDQPGRGPCYARDVRTRVRCDRLHTGITSGPRRPRPLVSVSASRSDNFVLAAHPLPGVGELPPGCRRHINHASSSFNLHRPRWGMPFHVKTTRPALRFLHERPCDGHDGVGSLGYQPGRASTRAMDRTSSSTAAAESGSSTRSPARANRAQVETGPGDRRRCAQTATHRGPPPGRSSLVSASRPPPPERRAGRMRGAMSSHHHVNTMSDTEDSQPPDDRLGDDRRLDHGVVTPPCVLSRQVEDHEGLSQRPANEASALRLAPCLLGERPRPRTVHGRSGPPLRPDPTGRPSSAVQGRPTVDGRVDPRRTCMRARHRRAGEPAARPAGGPGHDGLAHTGQLCHRRPESGHRMTWRSGSLLGLWWRPSSRARRTD